MTNNISAACPLCASKEVHTLETLRQEDVNAMYAKCYDVENAVSRSLALLKCSDCQLQFFSPPEAGGERLYERLQNYDWYYMADKWEYAEALKFINPASAVLEVGSGRAAFAHHVGKDRYIGLEFNLQAINRAKEAGISLIKVPVEVHAAEGHMYDVVVSFQVLEHVPCPAEFLRGCVGCLRSGGTLIVAVPAADGFVGQAVNNYLNIPPHHVTHWPDVTLKQLAPMFGLELLSLRHEPVAVYHTEWAGRVYYEARIRRALGLPARVLDRSFLARFIGRAAAFGARYFPPVLSHDCGHTVLAVYRKCS